MTDQAQDFTVQQTLTPQKRLFLQNMALSYHIITARSYYIDICAGSEIYIRYKKSQNLNYTPDPSIFTDIGNYINVISPETLLSEYRKANFRQFLKENDLVLLFIRPYQGWINNILYAWWDGYGGSTAIRPYINGNWSTKIALSETKIVDDVLMHRISWEQALLSGDLASICCNDIRPGPKKVQELPNPQPSDCKISCIMEEDGLPECKCCSDGIQSVLFVPAQNISAYVKTSNGGLLALNKETLSANNNIQNQNISPQNINIVTSIKLNETELSDIGTIACDPDLEGDTCTYATPTLETSPVSGYLVTEIYGKYYIVSGACKIEVSNPARVVTGISTPEANKCTTKRECLAGGYIWGNQPCESPYSDCSITTTPQP